MMTIYSLCFKGFIVLALLFRPAVHFELHLHMVWVSDQFHSLHVDITGFPGSSAGKENCNSGDPGSITGLGRSPEEGTGYPLQHSWASLVAQQVKNLPTMREAWVWPLGWDGPLEKWKATHSGILAWRIPCTVQSIGSQRDWATCTFTFIYIPLHPDSHPTQSYISQLDFMF